MTRRRRSPPLRPPTPILATEEGAGVDHRRSPRLRPQIQATEEGPGVGRRSSPRLHPQIQASEVVAAGVAYRRRSPGLHPQIKAGEGGAAVTRPRIRRRLGTSPAASASLPDDDDMLREILLRLPPQPSSLLRASAVCKRWLGLITDPRFLRSFRAHHRRPPLLGAFVRGYEGRIMFTPILDPPNRVCPLRFDLGRCSRSRCRDDCTFLDCRHGLLLVRDWAAQQEVVVCDPISGELRRRVAIPSEFMVTILWGAVLCAAGDLGHVHGGCHSGPFKVVLVSTLRIDGQALAIVYSSETGVWGNLISTVAPCELYNVRATLVGNALYWLSTADQILEFDFNGESLAVITVPPVTSDPRHVSRHIVQGEDGALGFVTFSCTCFRMWQRNVNCHGVATWLLRKTIELQNILRVHPQIKGGIRQVKILGYDEDNWMIFLLVDTSVYTVQLMSMQSRKLPETQNICNIDDYHPFTSFYTPGTPIASGFNGAKMLQIG